MSTKINENQVITLFQEIVMKNDSKEQLDDRSIVVVLELHQSVTKRKDVIVCGYGKTWVIDAKGEIISATG